MNNFLKTILFLVFGFFVVSCSKNDSASNEPIHDYADQYAKDIAQIEEFMHTHYMEVVNNPGATNDQDVTFTEIPEGGSQVSIWDQTEYPVQTHYVKQNNVKYKIYYLQFRQGSGANSKSPCNVDDVLTAYKGERLYTGKDTLTNGDIVDKTRAVEFEESVQPEAYFNLTKVIQGWSEIFPKFKTGSYVGNSDGTISYTDFGAGVMFIPSGLAYYSASKPNIPAYSSLIFSIKLYEVNRVDHDADGVYSYQEDRNGDGYIRVLSSGGANLTDDNDGDGKIDEDTDGDGVQDDDTDGDGSLDFLDVDDDQDYFTTKSEITKDKETGELYKFDEIPVCDDGKKRHLSKTCHAE